MTYDTTLMESVAEPREQDTIPACLKRNNLSPEWFPASTRSQLGMVAVLCCIFAWTSFNRLNHTDLWGHLQFGRWIVQHQSLPSVDPFSAVPLDRPLAANAWLGQVLGYQTFEHFGLEGLALGHALLATLGAGLMMAAIWRRGVPLCWAVAGGAAYYLLLLPIVGTIRPQLFGMVGAPLVLLACACLPEKRHPLFWLPFVFVLWANLHGSYAIGLALLGLYCIGATWRLLREKGSFPKNIADFRIVRLWSAVGLSLIGASLNPQGSQMLSTVLAFGQHTALANITEWRSMSLLSLSSGLFFVSLALLIATMALTPRRWELSDLLLVLVFGLLTPTALRMLAWWAVVWPWVIAPYAVAWWQTRIARLPDEAAPATPMRTVLALGVIFMTLLLSPASNNLLVGRERGIGAIAGDGTPVYLADEISRRELKGVLYAPMDWSDYLMWSQPNGLRPLVYSHIHLISPEVWTDHRKITAGASDWLALADKHHVRYLAISRDYSPQLTLAVVKYSRQPKSRAVVLYQDRKSTLVELVSEKGK